MDKKNTTTREAHTHQSTHNSSGRSAADSETRGMNPSQPISSGSRNEKRREEDSETLSPRHVGADRGQQRDEESRSVGQSQRDTEKSRRDLDNDDEIERRAPTSNRDEKSKVNFSEKSRK